MVLSFIISDEGQPIDKKANRIQLLTHEKGKPNNRCSVTVSVQYFYRKL